MFLRGANDQCQLIRSVHNSHLSADLRYGDLVTFGHEWNIVTGYRRFEPLRKSRKPLGIFEVPLVFTKHIARPVDFYRHAPVAPEIDLASHGAQQVRAGRVAAARVMAWECFSYAALWLVLTAIISALTWPLDDGSGRLILVGGVIACYVSMLYASSGDYFFSVAVSICEIVIAILNLRSLAIGLPLYAAVTFWAAAAACCAVYAACMALCEPSRSLAADAEQAGPAVRIEQVVVQIAPPRVAPPSAVRTELIDAVVAVPVVAIESAVRHGPDLFRRAPPTARIDCSAA